MLSHVLGATKMLDLPTTFYVPGKWPPLRRLTCSGQDSPYTTTVSVPESANFALFFRLLFKKYNGEHPQKPVDEILNAYVVEFTSMPDFSMPPAL